MTSNLNPELTENVNSEGLTASQTAGQMLREARLKAGMHLAFLSVNLKVSVRQLEAMEADEFESTKGPAFYRGLAASMCRQLNTDPAPVLALLPKSSGHLAPLKNVLNGSASERDVKFESRSSRMAVPGKVFWGAALMLLLTGALLWMPGPGQWTLLDNVKALLGGEVQTQEASDTVEISRMGESAPVLLNDASVNISPPVLTPSEAVASPSSQPQPPAKEFVSVAPTTQGSGQGPEWIFSATQDSWLEVRDAQQSVIWSGVVKAGESQRIQNPLPVNVVVGRAAAVNVTFRGQPFDLKPHTRYSVARFDVKE